ncbi:MAG: B12-binding domain-containing radical SAM protein [Planctomycetota bacterium]
MNDHADTGIDRQDDELAAVCPVHSPQPAPRRFQHVICVYPYRRELSGAGFCPPLGIEYIAAVLKPYAERIDMIDLRYETGHVTDFLRPETDLVCFSMNWDRDREVWPGEIASVPADVLTLVGGRHATEDPARWLTEFPNVDVVFRGDSEDAVGEFCEGAELADIAGVSFRRGQDGEVVHNPNRQLGGLRDDLHPLRHLRRANYELTVEGISLGMGFDAVSSSRGCPFNCVFCSFNRNPWGEKRKWVARSPEAVVDELAGVEAPLVAFVDDLFTHDMDRVARICDLLVARGIRKKYVINARLEIAKRPDVLRKMEKAGFVMLLLGIESAHDKTLRSMGKGFDTARIRKYFEELRGRPMLLHGYFILGNIGESISEMRQIVPFAHSLGVDTLALSTLRSSPYSGLDELVAATDGYHIAENGKIYSDFCSVKELRQLRRELNHQFYCPSQILRIMDKGLRFGAMELIARLLPHAPAIVRLRAILALKTGPFARPGRPCDAWARRPCHFFNSPTDPIFAAQADARPYDRGRLERRQGHLITPK